MKHGLANLLPVQKFILTCPDRLIILAGALGSAKTTAGGIFSTVSVLTRREMCRGLHLAQTKTQIKQTLNRAFVDVLNRFSIYENKQYTENRTEGMFKFANQAEVSYGYYLGKGSERHQSIEYSYCIVEEPHLMSYEGFQNVIRRLRYAEPYKLILMPNAQGPSHWIYKELVKKNKGTYYFARLEDNPYLPEGEKDRLYKTLSPQMYARMVLGEWISLEGAVFNSELLNRDEIYIQKIPHGLRPVQWLGGLDLGKNTAYVLGFVATDGHFYLVADYSSYDESPNYKAQEILKLNKLIAGEGVYVTIFSDHDSDIRKVYKDNGVHTVPALKLDKAGNIARLEALLSTRRLFFTPGSNDTLENLENLSYKDDTEIIKKVNDHLFDAYLYCVMGGQSLGYLELFDQKVKSLIGKAPVQLLKKLQNKIVF